MHAIGISANASDYFQVTVEEMQEYVWACCPKTVQRALHKLVLNLV